MLTFAILFVGGTVVQWLALSVHSKSLWPFYVDFTFAFMGSLWLSPSV